MVDVSRRSTFLPILKDYHSNISVQNDPRSLRPHQWQATAGIRQLMQRNGITVAKVTDPDAASKLQRKPKERKVVTHKVESSKQPLITTDRFKREYETELRQRNHKRFENVLKSWDASLQWERDKKFHNLQQRVRIQRELITKNNQLSDQLRKKAEDEQIDKLQARRQAQKEMTDSLRAHIIRVEEHKKKIAEKLNEISQENDAESVKDREEEADESEHSSSSSVLRKNLSVAIKDGSRLASPRVETSSRLSLVKSPLTQIIGEAEGKSMQSIGAMWSEWRTDAVRRLQPIIRHSQQLKNIASPSVKQFLDIYNQPIPRDRFTGKPIPLGDVLENISNSVSSAGHHTAANNALQVVLSQAETKANIMLRRNDPYNHFDPSSRRNEGFFVQDKDHPKEDQLETVADITAPNVESNTDTRSLQHKRVISTKVKKQFPCYLKNTGDLVSGSLVEIGDYLACGPTTRMRDHENTGSVFLTDLNYEDNQELSHTEAVSTLSSQLKTHSDTQTKFPSRWQPLSSGALTEYKNVSEIPVKGLSHLAHGRYKVWKPASCVVQETQDSN